MNFKELKLLKIASVALIALSFATAHAEEEKFEADGYDMCEAQADCGEACLKNHSGDRNAIRACEVACDDKCGDAKPAGEPAEAPAAPSAEAPAPSAE